MVRASSGNKRGGRRLLKRGIRHKFTVERILQGFKPGDRVILSVDPSSRRGMPPLRLVGLAGIVLASRGTAYMVAIRDGNKRKDVLVRPEHLKLV
ncbi:MAG: 50S ribosomal protein L21e [Candidatus Aenigmarchaeota archaeon]|nr:50S ribosomal protein L21e [Candidatus Aenigmarchaeota archaeon]